MKELWELIRRFDLKGLLVSPTENGMIQFFRYVIVGGIATVVDWGVQYFLTEAGIHYLVSAVFAFFAGLSVNFLLSKIFVFKAEKARVGTALEFAAYAAIGGAGLLLTVGIMYVLTDVLHLHYMLSKVAATFIVLFWNYFARKKLVYEGRKKK